MRTLVMTAAALALSATAAAAEFTIAFAWGDTPACNTGRARTVASPAFVVRGLPKGADTVALRMQDLDAPAYNHGGGKVKISQSGTVPAGAFTYKGPCPPRAVHRYRWTATARQGGKVLGTAAATRRFPE